MYNGFSAHLLPLLQLLNKRAEPRILLLQILNLSLEQFQQSLRGVHGNTIGDHADRAHNPREHSAPRNLEPKGLQRIPRMSRPCLQTPPSRQPPTLRMSSTYFLLLPLSLPRTYTMIAPGVKPIPSIKHADRDLTDGLPRCRAGPGCVNRREDLLRCRKRCTPPGYTPEATPCTMQATASRSPPHPTHRPIHTAPRVNT